MSRNLRSELFRNEPRCGDRCSLALTMRYFRLRLRPVSRTSCQEFTQWRANINEKDVIITLQIHYNLILRNKLVGTSFMAQFFFVLPSLLRLLFYANRIFSLIWRPHFCEKLTPNPVRARKELNLNNFPLFSSTLFALSFCRERAKGL